jgi:hypothetical protein
LSGWWRTTTQGTTTDTRKAGRTSRHRLVNPKPATKQLQLNKPTTSKSILNILIFAINNFI